MSAIQSTAGSLKLALDGLKTLLSLKVTADTQAKIVEVQSAIITAQVENMAANEERSTLLQRVRELEEKVAQMEKWEAEAQRYELKRFSPNTLAYRVKESARGTEPVHLLCTRCFHEKRKSILQFTETSTLNGREYACMACRGKVILSGRNGTFHGDCGCKSNSPKQGGALHGSAPP